MIIAAIAGLALIQGPSLPLTGTVVDRDGMPVVEAELILTGPTPGESPVVARGRSGEGGSFRLDRPAGLAPTNRYLAPTLWSIAPGRAASVIKFAGGVPGADEPVRVILGPAARTEIRVEAPDGTPVAGARISVQQIRSEPMPVPDPVADLAERTTGPDGLAVLDAFGPDEVGLVDVIAGGYGIQPRWLDPARPGPKRVRLLPVGSLAGRLVPEAGRPQAARGWRVRAWTDDYVSDPRAQQRAGYGSATTDAEGRFAIAEIAPGSLRLSVSPPDGADLLPELPKPSSVAEGKESALEIPLRRPSTITGRVVEHGTGAPVVGMRVILSRTGGGGGGDSKTDEQGRYEFRSLAGKASVWGPEPPPGFVASPGLNRHDIEVPAAPGRVDLGTTEILRAAPPMKGEVRDETGRPVAGASVAGSWTASTPLGPSHGSTAATADDRGGFALGGIPPGAKVELTARRRDRATVGPVTADPGGGRPIILEIVPRATVAVSGRVLGPGGGPVEGASVRLRSRDATASHPNPFGEQVALEGNPPIRTGPDGIFRTPKELDRQGREFRAEVDADDFHPATTPWTPAGEGDVALLPETTLRRSMTTRVVSGRVVDRDGGPVAGVRAFQAGDGPRPTGATSDAAGRFRLAGVYSGPALMFAEKAGFRFGGAVAAGDGDVEVRLAPEGGPPVARLATLPSTMARAEERALARELLAPVLPLARAGAIDHLGDRAIPALARVDPERALRMVEDRVLARPAAALVQAALALAEDDPRGAIATIEADLDPGSRAAGFLALADTVPAGEGARRADLLDRSLAEARRSGDPVAKVKLLGEVADRWLAVGDLGRAAPILREGRAAVEAIPAETWSFEIEAFGEVLAAVDLPAARGLFERKGRARVSPPDERTVNRHLGEAAVRIAAIDPAEAGRLSALRDVGPNLGDREDLVFRVARMMARADLPRAREILREIADRPENPTFARPALVPYGLGLMAMERAEVDPASARGLLDEAFAGLVAIGRDRGGRSNPPAAILMAALLPVVERVDPDRLAERLWLAASCRPPRAQEPTVNDFAEMTTLALLVSRYDRAAAGVIAAPALERLPAILGEMDHPGHFDSRNFDMVAALDPRAIDALIRALPPSARKSERTRDGWFIVAAEVSARLSAAEMLGRPIAERRRAAIERSSYLWQMLPERR